MQMSMDMLNWISHHEENTTCREIVEEMETLATMTIGTYIRSKSCMYVFMYCIMFVYRIRMKYERMELCMCV